MKVGKIIFLPAVLAIFSSKVPAATLELDPQQSKVEVVVSATMDSFVGHLQKYDAQVECEPQVVLPSKAEVSFDFTDLKTGNKDRDAAMLKWLDYTANPKVTFHLDTWKQAGMTNIAVGQLTIHGVTKAVESPVVVKEEGRAWDINGTTEFDYRDFNLPKIRKALVLTVDPHLKVAFHLVGKLADAK